MPFCVPLFGGALVCHDDEKKKSIYGETNQQINAALRCIAYRETTVHFF